MKQSSAYSRSILPSNMKRILLVGREGNGKSSCALTVKNISTEAVKLSGVGDTGEDRKENIQTIVNNVQKVMYDYKSFDAIGLVLKYGVRFTKQEKDAVEVVRSMFGNDVFRRNGIIIMSYGDLFELDNGDDQRSFEQWCREQSGDIQKLFEEVNYRIVLLDNKTKDSERQKCQHRELSNHIGSIKLPYSTREFDNARNGREILISREKPYTGVYIGNRNGEFRQANHTLAYRLGNVCLITATIWLLFGIYMNTIFWSISGIIWLTTGLAGATIVIILKKIGTIMFTTIYVYLTFGFTFICFIYFILIPTKEEDSNPKA